MENNISWRSPNYLLTVKNDRLGWMLIEHLKMRTKGVYKIVLRGRHSNRKQVMRDNGLNSNWTNDIPVRLSERIAIYLRKK